MNFQSLAISYKPTPSLYGSTHSAQPSVLEVQKVKSTLSMNKLLSVF